MLLFDVNHHIQCKRLIVRWFSTNRFHTHCEWRCNLHCFGQIQPTVHLPCCDPLHYMWDPTVSSGCQHCWTVTVWFDLCSALARGKQRLRWCFSIYRIMYHDLPQANRFLQVSFIPFKNLLESAVEKLIKKWCIHVQFEKITSFIRS